MPIWFSICDCSLYHPPPTLFLHPFLFLSMSSNITSNKWYWDWNWASTFSFLRRLTFHDSLASVGTLSDCQFKSSSLFFISRAKEKEEKKKKKKMKTSILFIFHRMLDWKCWDTDINADVNGEMNFLSLQSSFSIDVLQFRFRLKPHTNVTKSSSW